MQSLPSMSPLGIRNEMVPEGNRIPTGPRRDPYLPVFFQVTSHPLLPPNILKYLKNIYVYAWDGNNKAYAQQFLAHIKDNVTIPEGPNEEIKEIYGKSFFNTLQT